MASGDIETALRRKAGKGYVLGRRRPIMRFVPGARSSLSVAPPPEIAQNLPRRRLAASVVAAKEPKVERLHEWAYLELADLDAG